jgi:dihydroorotase
LGLKGIPGAAEAIMVARDILLAELTGGHVHLCHMSARQSVDLIRAAKERGVNVTAEVTPHHLTLEDACCEGYDTNAKMNPPLRTEGDIEACIAGLLDGTLDFIATDHAPHHYESKEREFENAPFGVVGLETSLGLMKSELVDKKRLTLPDLISKMSHVPAQAFNLQAGTLSPGVAADVVVFAPDETWVVDPGKFLSKSRNTPFGGRELTGRVHRTYVDGNLVFDSGGR